MFLTEPAATPAVQQMYDDDLAGDGYVMNLTRVWAHVPAAYDGLTALLADQARTAGLTDRDRGVLVSALASTLGDAYCSLAYGGRLARWADERTAVAVLSGADDGLSDRDRTLAAWARQVARDPNGTTAADVAALRAVGFDDRQVAALTAYVALRLAFSTVNDALGAHPDAELADAAPAGVRDAITWGRPPAPGPA